MEVFQYAKSRSGEIMNYKITYEDHLDKYSDDDYQKLLPQFIEFQYKMRILYAI